MKTVRKSDAFRRAEINRLIRQAMQSPQFKEMRRKEMEQAVLQAMTKFAFIGCEWLDLEHEYHHDDFLRFAEWLRVRYIELGDDEGYLRDVSKYYKDKHDADIMRVLGTTFEKK